MRRFRCSWLGQPCPCCLEVSRAVVFPCISMGSLLLSLVSPGTVALRLAGHQ